MKLEINLNEVEAYDDENIASIINETVKDEVRFFIKKITKKELAVQEKAIKAIVQKAVSKNWRKVAVILETLKENNGK